MFWYIKGVQVGTYLGQVSFMSDLKFSSFEISNVSIPAENTTVDFWAEPAEIWSNLFETLICDAMHCNASGKQQVFVLFLKKHLKLSQKNYGSF